MPEEAGPKGAQVHSWGPTMLLCVAPARQLPLSLASLSRIDRSQEDPGPKLLWPSGFRSLLRPHPLGTETVEVVRVCLYAVVCVGGRPVACTHTHVHPHTHTHEEP